MPGVRPGRGVLAGRDVRGLGLAQGGAPVQCRIVRGRGRAVLRGVPRPHDDVAGERDGRAAVQVPGRAGATARRVRRGEPVRVRGGVLEQDGVCGPAQREARAWGSGRVQVRVRDGALSPGGRWLAGQVQPLFVREFEHGRDDAWG